MTYIEGFVIAVPTANRQKFIDHAHLGDTVFMEHGATRVVECWEEDVPKGKINDFFGEVASREDESIVFSWIEWPAKATRQAKADRIEESMKSAERSTQGKNTMPFDDARVRYGRCEPAAQNGAEPTEHSH